MAGWRSMWKPVRVRSLTGPVSRPIPLPPPASSPIGCTDGRGALACSHAYAASIVHTRHQTKTKDTLLPVWCPGCHLIHMLHAPYLLKMRIYVHLMHKTGPRTTHGIHPVRLQDHRQLGQPLGDLGPHRPPGKKNAVQGNPVKTTAERKRQALGCSSRAFIFSVCII